MSTIKSDNSDLTINASGSTSDIKFQANGVEKASISSAGAFTSTTIDATVLTGNLPAISGASLTGVGGLYASVAIIVDQKTSGTTSGTFTSGAWRTRDLNTEISDADGIVSIASNQFTLQAGTYTIEWLCPANSSGRSRSKVKNITDTSDVGYGLSSHGYDDQAYALGYAQVTISSAKAFEVQHYCQLTKDGNGFGIDGSSGGGGEVEKYTTVKIYKHA
jgi:hypothetical protein